MTILRRRVTSLCKKLLKSFTTGRPIPTDLVPVLLLRDVRRVEIYRKGRGHKGQRDQEGAEEPHNERFNAQGAEQGYYHSSPGELQIIYVLVATSR